MNAGAADFLPYYSELKFAGHMAVSLAAAFAGGFGMWLAALYFSAAGRFGFCDSFAVSLFCASAVWIIPAGLPIPPLWEKIGMAAFLAFPLFVCRFAFGLEWRKSIALGASFCAAQAAVFSAVYYYIMR